MPCVDCNRWVPGPVSDNCAFGWLLVPSNLRMTSGWGDRDVTYSEEEAASLEQYWAGDGEWHAESIHLSLQLLLEFQFSFATEAIDCVCCVLEVLVSV